MKFPVTPKKEKPFQAVSFGYNSCDILCLMQGYPKADSKTRLDRLIREGGGQAATAAVALARWGFSTRYVGKFGDTPEGEFARASLEKEGVDAAGCLLAEGTQNQVAVIWIDQISGERTITYIREPGLEIQPHEVDRKAATAGSVLLIDGHNLPATTQLATWAREEGIPVLLDIERNLEGSVELLEQVDYILCDETFPVAYTGEHNGERALQVISERHPRATMVAMTMGAHGSLAVVEGQFLHTPAYEVDVVDTTGAGDVWHAGLAAGLILDWDIEDALRLAAAASALKCRRLGGRAGIGNREELLDFLHHAQEKRFPV